MEFFNPQSSLKQDRDKEYNIILFGETGSGKSTLINYLTNYFHDGTLRNMKIAIPTKHYDSTEGLKHNEHNVQDSSKSQTRACNVYSFRKKDTTFKFIDTPGLSDTKGVDQDDFNIQQIMGAAEQREELTAIILVINGTQARGTVNIRNTLCLLRSSIPDILLQNVVVVLTHCSAVSVNFDLAHLLSWPIAEANVFHMDNCALSRPVSEWANNERMEKRLEQDWQSSMETIEALIQNLTKLGGKATEAFKQMRFNRNEIKCQLFHILFEVKKFQDLQNELGILKITKETISVDIKKYSDYKRTKQIEYTVWERREYFSKFCIVCMKHCHEYNAPSAAFQLFLEVKTVPFYRDVLGVFEFVFQGICHCHHLPFSHIGSNAQSVKKTETVEEILEDVKSAYDDNVRKNKEIQSKIGNLDNDIAVVRYILDKKEAEILKCCHELKKLCSQFNFVDELQGVIAVMERDARTLHSTVARADAENRIRNIKHVVDTLSKAEKSD